MDYPCFTITNPLLIQAFYGGYRCKKAPLQKSCGYFATDEPPVGRAFLEYCYSIMFNIRRFPGYESYYTGRPYSNWFIGDGELSDKDIQNACIQLDELYTFTQNVLENEPQQIELYRCMRDHEIKKIISVNEHGKVLLKTRTNIIVSFAYSEHHNYSTGFQIKKSIAKKDILAVPAYMKCANDTLCQFIPVDGEHEVLVINKDKYGNILFSPNDVLQDKNNVVKRAISLSELQLSNENFYTKDYPMLATPYTPKPCERSTLLQYLIQREIRKIKKNNK